MKYLFATFMLFFMFPTLSFSYCKAEGHLLDTDSEGTLYIENSKQGMLYLEDIDGDFYVDILSLHDLNNGYIEAELETKNFMRKGRHKVFYFEIDKRNSDDCF